MTNDEMIESKMDGVASITKKQIHEMPINNLVTILNLLDGDELGCEKLFNKFYSWALQRVDFSDYISK